MDRVIFACRHNAGRSQMAAAFFSQLADPARATVASAGTTPARQVHPEVVAVMREKPPERVREIRDEIRRRIEDLVETRGWALTTGA